MHFFPWLCNLLLLRPTCSNLLCIVFLRFFLQVLALNCINYNWLLAFSFGHRQRTLKSTAVANEVQVPLACAATVRIRNMAYGSSLTDCMKRSIFKLNTNSRYRRQLNFWNHNLLRLMLSNILSVVAGGRMLILIALRLPSDRVGFLRKLSFE